MDPAVDDQSTIEVSHLNRPVVRIAAPSLSTFTLPASLLPELLEGPEEQQQDDDEQQRAEEADVCTGEQAEEHGETPDHDEAVEDSHLLNSPLLKL